MSFYDALVIAMKQKNISVADICSKTGLHPSYFSKLKSGYTKDVTWEKALMIIDAIDMNPDEFSALQKQDD